jgi:hypothetical protein
MLALVRQCHAKLALLRNLRLRSVGTCLGLGLPIAECGCCPLRKPLLVAHRCDSDHRDTTHFSRRLAHLVDVVSGRWRCFGNRVARDTMR